MSDNTSLLVGERDLSVVIPSYNEAENIPVLLDRLAAVLQHLDYEIIVVDDDSPDGTWQIVQAIGASDPRVRLIRRTAVKGLSSAVVAGLRESVGRCMVVMDADLQHDEQIIPAMYQRVIADQHDVCVGSREAEGGSYGTWSYSRRIVSAGARMLANLALGRLTRDPMSGFFALSHTYFDATVDKVNPQGFKILIEFLARGKNPKVCELGYEFGNRLHGQTKLNSSVAIDYLLALVDLRFGWFVPHQFVKFGLVGLLGSIINFLGFATVQGMGFSVTLAVLVGVELAIIWTYLGNNFFTFTPMTFRGRDLAIGFLHYQAVCCYGLVVQLAVVRLVLSEYPAMSNSLFTLYLTYLVAVVFAAVGNFFLHSYYTWNRNGYTMTRPVRSPRVASH